MTQTNIYCFPCAKPAIVRGKLVPRTLCEAKKVAGSVKQYTLCCPLWSVCSFRLFSHETRIECTFKQIREWNINI